ncbi:MAG: hypothetical protein IT547_08470 [Hyphomonadaceae bacterium]|nr:hypothetical protein [Hyphomonadaceae bacterium]
MTVPTRYILAAFAFCAVALAHFIAPTDASACGNNGCPTRPPCHQGCNPTPPPPPPQCCERPTVVVPPPNVPAPNVVIVNAGARASAQANATAIAIANVRTGDTIIRQNMVMESGASAQVQSGAFAIVEASAQAETVARERDLLIQAICLDAQGNPHPASQTFGGRDVAQDYRGEIFRCMSGTRMRYTAGDRSYDCEQGQALWYEGARAECRTQQPRRPCNERSLLRRFGPGEKNVHIRDTEARTTQTETTFNAAMTMDGGVGQSVW